MEDSIEELVSVLSTNPISDDILSKITNILQESDVKFLFKFITENFSSLFILEDWAWKMLNEDNCQWIGQEKYLELFENLALFNKNLILYFDEIDSEKKASLLIPQSTDLINNLFEHVENLNDENNLYFIIASLWIDNLSYFIYDHVEFVILPIIIHIDNSIASRFVMIDQYKYYLTQLEQAEISQTIFTNKQLFYIKTCSFSISTYFYCTKQTFPFTADEILHYFAQDYLKIVYLHSFTTQSWSVELLCCITHIINFIGACCCWSDNKAERIKMLLPTEEISHDYIHSLIRILSYKPFHQQLRKHRCNDVTILIDAILNFLASILETHDLVCFIRMKTTLLEILLPLAETSVNNRISLCAYAILGEILSDEHLKELKITNNICEYLFYLLEQAWKDPYQKFQRVPVSQLLRAFLGLAKNDIIQQKAADTKKVPLFIEMSREYPIVFDILWALSFNHDIQNQLRSNEKLMLILTHLENDVNNPQIRKITHGILWNLELDHDDHSTSEKKEEITFDIMISYSHKDKDLCKQLYDGLVKAGYRVWIDFDQMHGNVMDAMAQAIERSKTILICMSEQYRRSNYCRAEAYYAFQRQLRIVPVLLEKHYKPDGWLLFLIGQLLYIDFTKYDFIRAMDMLLKELKAPITRLESKIETNFVTTSLPLPLPMLTSSLSSSSSPIIKENIQEWNTNDVQDWLIGNNLIQMSQLLSDYDGLSLINLSKYLTGSTPSDTILHLLQEDSLRRINQNVSLIELARFQTLLNQQLEIISSDSFKQETKKNKTKHKSFRLNKCKIM